MKLKDPRTMRQEDLIKFFKHVGNRQTSHGIKDAFQFKAVLSSRKKGSIEEPKYNDTTPTTALTKNVPEPRQTEAADEQAPESEPASEMGPATTSKGNQNQTGTQTFVFQLDNRVRELEPASFPRPKPRPTGKAKKKTGVDDYVSTSRPAAISTVESGPAPGPASNSRPKPRPTGKAKNITGVEDSGNVSMPITDNSGAPHENMQNQQSSLTFETPFDWDLQIPLDPDLDPGLHATDSINRNHDLSSWLTIPSSTMPNSPSSDLVRTPRRKGKNADSLAMEEAKALLSKRKSRR